MKRTLPFLLIAFTLVAVSACGQNPSQSEAEDHEHGPETHTHGEAMTADTAGTYVDTTSALFGDQSDHEHGPETHEHDPQAEEQSEEDHEHGPETHTHDEEGDHSHQ